MRVSDTPRGQIAEKCLFRVSDTLRGQMGRFVRGGWTQHDGGVLVLPENKGKSGFQFI